MSGLVHQRKMYLGNERIIRAKTIVLLIQYYGCTSCCRHSVDFMGQIVTAFEIRGTFEQLRFEVRMYAGMLGLYWLILAQQENIKNIISFQILFLHKKV